MPGRGLGITLGGEPGGRYGDGRRRWARVGYTAMTAGFVAAGVGALVADRPSR